VKSVFSERHYEVMFSDFTNVWHEHLEGCDVEQRSQVCEVKNRSALQYVVAKLFTECYKINIFVILLEYNFWYFVNHFFANCIFIIGLSNKLD